MSIGGGGSNIHGGPNGPGGAAAPFAPTPDDPRLPSFHARLQSIGNINLASAPASYDGTAANLDDVLFFNNQADLTEAGLYKFAGTGNPLVRITGFDETVEFAFGARVWVGEGNTLNDQVWNLSSDNVDVGVDDIVFIQPGAGLVVSQNESWVDATKSSGVGTRSDRTKQFPTIALADTASSTDDLLHLASGTPAEAWALTHNLFVDGIGAALMTSIGQSSGRLTGRIGFAMFSRNGLDIYSTGNTAANKDLFDMLFASAKTITVVGDERYPISASGAVTMLWPSFESIDIGGAGADHIDLGSVGSSPMRFTATATGVSIRHGEKTNLVNLICDNTINHNIAAGVDFVGQLRQVECSSYIFGGNNQFKGHIHGMKATDAVTINSTGANNNGRIHGITAGGLVTLKNWNGHAIIEAAQAVITQDLGELAMVEIPYQNVAGSSIAVRDNHPKSIVRGGNIRFINNADSSTRYKGKVIDTIADMFPSFGGGSYIDKEFELINSTVRDIGASALGEPVTHSESGARFTRSTIKYSDYVPANSRSANLTHIFDACTFLNENPSDPQVKVALGNGARLYNPIFIGWPVTTNPLESMICGPNYCGPYGSDTNPIRWDVSDQKLIMHMDTHPQEDVAGTATNIATGVTNNTMLYDLGTGATLEDLEGQLVGMELFIDAGNIYLEGVNEIFYRSVAAEATRLSGLLGTPGSDVIGGSEVEQTFIGVGISVEINNPVGDGLIGSEVSLVSLEAIDSGLISGVKFGGVVTVNAGDAAKVDVSAGKGIIIDWTNPSRPLPVTVSWAAQIAVTLTGIATDTFTTLYFDSAGVLQQKPGELFTEQERRQNVLIDAAVHGNFTTVTSIATNSIQAYQAVEAILDYINVLGAVNVGNRIIANAANLLIDKTAGTTTLPFINRDTDPQNPATATDPLQSNINPFTYSHQDGGGDFDFIQSQTAIDPDQFDDGSGTLASVQNNKWTIQRALFFSQNQAIAVTYGQAEYGSLAEAEAAIFSEAPAVSPLFSTGVFVTAIIVKKGATDLSDIAEAKFVDIINETSAGSGGVPAALPTFFNIPSTIFMTSADATSKPENYDKAAGGVRVQDSSNELFAEMPIPPGTTATNVDIACSSNRPFEIWEKSLSTGVKVSKGTGTTGTTLNITNIPSAQGFIMLIEVDVNSDSQTVFGGSLTLIPS